ncbi:hypothetical protein QBC41DRAFT_345934 [Cercophora samala]|uniref:Uncharacterized protein n=1 Tax=Cercophora samala TaxID=330535 RepID=A0AA39ZF97_9PEZI|nr:hypothetical protein QBC41DRAFT_345934 [Cercophora samala]
MSTSRIFPWASIKPKLLTPEGRFISDDKIYADVAWDILVEAANRNHLQDMHDDAWRALRACRQLRESGSAGIDVELQYAFFFILSAMLKVQLKVQERDGLPESQRGDRSPSGESTDSGVTDVSGQSADFVKIDMADLRYAMAQEGVKVDGGKGVLGKVSGWVFGKGKK